MKCVKIKEVDAVGHKDLNIKSKFVSHWDDKWNGTPSMFGLLTKEWKVVV